MYTVNQKTKYTTGYVFTYGFAGSVWQNEKMRVYHINETEAKKLFTDTLAGVYGSDLVSNFIIHSITNK